jgi:DNA-binding CsgD family transcriptional regulator
METNELAAVAPMQDVWAPQAILDLGRPMFHATLLRGLHDVVGVDHMSHLRYDRTGRIGYARCASLLDQSMIEWTTDVYVNRLYQRDPNYQRVCESIRDPVSDVHLVSVSPESIRDREYRQQLFEKPGFASKISLFGTWGERTCYINLYFSRAVSSRTTALLRYCGPSLIALAQRHDEFATQPPPSIPVATIDMESLSVRERQVAELLWRGHTAKEVARALNLSPTTVLTYKSRLFEKTNSANLKEFLLRSPGRVQGAVH